MIEDYVQEEDLESDDVPKADLFYGAVAGNLKKEVIYWNQLSWEVFSFFNLPPSSEELGDDVVHGP